MLIKLIVGESTTVRQILINPLFIFSAGGKSRDRNSVHRSLRSDNLIRIEAHICSSNSSNRAQKANTNQVQRMIKKVPDNASFSKRALTV